MFLQIINLRSKALIIKSYALNTSYLATKISLLEGLTHPPTSLNFCLIAADSISGLGLVLWFWLTTESWLMISNQLRLFINRSSPITTQTYNWQKPSYFWVNKSNLEIPTLCMHSTIHINLNCALSMPKIYYYTHYVWNADCTLQYDKFHKLYSNHMCR